MAKTGVDATSRMTNATAPEAATARIAFLRGLRAVRQLRPDPLPELVLYDILEVARWSGSAGNRQPWEFVVVRDRTVLTKLARVDGANAGHLATAAPGIAVVIRSEVPSSNPRAASLRGACPPGRKPLEQLVHWDRY